MTESSTILYAHALPAALADLEDLDVGTIEIRFRPLDATNRIRLTDVVSATPRPVDVGRPAITIDGYDDRGAIRRRRRVDVDAVDVVELLVVDRPGSAGAGAPN